MYFNKMKDVEEKQEKNKNENEIKKQKGQREIGWNGWQAKEVEH